MTADVLARQFELNHMAIHANLHGVTHEQSLTHPAPAGNCLNWVVGHIVATRNMTLRALNAAPIWDEGEAAPYARGARPPLSSTRAQQLTGILTALDESQRTLVDRLRTLTADDLARPAGNGTLGEFLATLSFHEAYHAGQCGLLRRLAGLDGAIA